MVDAYLFLATNDIFLTATKPFTPNAFRALVTAAVHLPMVDAYLFLATNDIFLLTILPDLLFSKSVFFKPEVVFSLRPLKTLALARFPLATFEIFIAFFAFIAFAAFMTLMALPAFIAFIAFAMACTTKAHGGA